MLSLPDGLCKELEWHRAVFIISRVSDGAVVRISRSLWDHGPAVLEAALVRFAKGVDHWRDDVHQVDYDPDLQVITVTNLAMEATVPVGVAVADG